MQTSLDNKPYPKRGTSWESKCNILLCIQYPNLSKVKAENQGARRLIDRHLTGNDFSVFSWIFVQKF